jgi:hypothetical protein
LITQMMVGPLIDSQGHDFRLNDAFVKAVVLLDCLNSENQNSS